MIVRFTTRVGALTMHGEAAVALLRAMGHSGTVPGAILAADLAGALARLRSALDAQPEPPPGDPERDAWDDADGDADERAPPISLRTRAVPLLDLMQTAVARESDLMWERG